jgi:hypothetical protein
MAIKGCFGNHQLITNDEVAGWTLRECARPICVNLNTCWTVSRWSRTKKLKFVVSFHATLISVHKNSFIYLQVFLLFCTLSNISSERQRDFALRKNGGMLMQIMGVFIKWNKLGVELIIFFFSLICQQLIFFLSFKWDF